MLDTLLQVPVYLLLAAALGQPVFGGAEAPEGYGESVAQAPSCEWPPAFSELVPGPGTAALIAYRPSGKPGMETPPAEVLRELEAVSARQLVSRSGLPRLMQVPVTAAPGGVRVSLDGRFRSMLVGRRSAAGSVEATCEREDDPIPGAPVAADPDRPGVGGGGKR